LIFSLGGAAAMAGAKDAAPGAALSAIAPVLILVAVHERILGFGAREAWGAAALGLAGLDALVFLQTARARSDAAAAFATGAALAFAAALYFVTPAPYGPLAIAAGLALVALFERWRSEPALKSGLNDAALILCAALLARLAAPEFFVVTASPLPLLALL